MRGILTIIFVVAAGVAVLWAGTDGLRVLTAEGARRLAVQENSKPLPDVVMTDQNGTPFRFSDFQGKVVLVEFIYTRCATICSRLGDTFNVIQERMIDQDVVLVSISFDPRDQTEDLKDYANRYDAIVPRWRVARVLDQENLAQMLAFFAVTVIEDGFGDFEHNAAVLVADRDGLLVDVVDDQPLNVPMEAAWKRL